MIEEVRPAATHGGELYRVFGITAIPYQSRTRDDKNGQSNERRQQQPHASFREMYDSEKNREVSDIDVQTRGYTRTGAPAKLMVHMHDYTNQKKHA